MPEDKIQRQNFQLMIYIEHYFIKIRDAFQMITENPNQIYFKDNTCIVSLITLEKIRFNTNTIFEQLREISKFQIVMKHKVSNMKRKLQNKIQQKDPPKKNKANGILKSSNYQDSISDKKENPNDTSADKHMQSSFSDLNENSPNADNLRGDSSGVNDSSSTQKGNNIQGQMAVNFLQHNFSLLSYFLKSTQKFFQQFIFLILKNYFEIFCNASLFEIRRR